MGRKIPGKKHRGVRDPEKQREQRLQLQKVNAPPSNVDDQPVPKSVQRIAELMKKTKTPSKVEKKPIKNIKKNKNTKKLIVIQTKVDRNEKTVPKFVQIKGESDKAFLYRCNKICESVKQEVDFEAKFGVEVKRNPETGKIENTLKIKKDDPIKQMMKDAKKEAKKKQKKKKKNSDVVKLTKSEKRKLKLKMKKEKKKERMDDFESTDKVEFGEVNHAPPVLTVPKKVEQRNDSVRPGQKKLLLTSIINGENPSKIKKSTPKSVLKKVQNKAIDKKGKRKDLPSKVRKQLEQHQKEIIEAYKAMKGQKKKTT